MNKVVYDIKSFIVKVYLKVKFLLCKLST